jgi:hypothetical protein
VNFFDDEAQRGSAPPTRGPTWDRLMAIKACYDPTSLCSATRTSSRRASLLDSRDDELSRSVAQGGILQELGAIPA